MHLDRNELREARSRLRQLDAALAVSPDKLIAAVACLAAAYNAWPRGVSETAVQIPGHGTVGVARSAVGPAKADPDRVAGARRGRRHRGSTRHRQAGHCDKSLEATVTLAHAWLAAGDRNNARRVLAPALTVPREAPGQVRLHAWLVDARLSYGSGDQHAVAARSRPRCG